MTTTSTPTTTTNGFPGWSNFAKGLWEAKGYLVPGSTFVEALHATPDLFKIIGIQAWKTACEECLENGFSPECDKICDEHEKMKAKFTSTSPAPTTASASTTLPS